MAARQFIYADSLIVGDGNLIRDGLVVLAAKKIEWVGAAQTKPFDHAAADVIFHSKTVMPGMWDVHVHFTGISTPDISETQKFSPAMACLRAVPDLQRMLNAGFTSVREPGYGHGLTLEQAREEGCIVGPKIYAAGAALSPTGGHADIHCYPAEFWGGQVIGHDADSRASIMCCCDGKPECLKAVRKNFRRGAKFIKICASGGVLTEIDHPLHQQFSNEELRTIVEEAGRGERIVAAHCHGKPGIMAALHAGCTTIEHGSFLDEEAADLMKEKGAILVATRLVCDRMKNQLDILSPLKRTKAETVIAAHLSAMKIARRKGIPFALGTDSLTAGASSPLCLGESAREMELFVSELGFSAMEAIVAATGNGPKCLGKQAPLSGLLIKGYDADVIVVAGDPLDDIKVLKDTSKITHVWLDGSLVKSPPDEPSQVNV